MIDVTFTLTEAEFLEGQLLSARVSRRSEFYKRWLYILLSVAILVILVPSTLLLVYGKIFKDPRIGLSLPFLSEDWFLLLIGLFEVQVGYALFDLITLKHVKKQLKNIFLQSRPGHTDTNLKIDDSGLLDQTPASGTTNVQWSNFTDWIDGDSVLILRRSGLLLHLVPKRILTSSKLAEAIELITDRLGSPVKVPKF